MQYSIAQTTTQTIKGTVVDRDTNQPLIGATILVTDLTPAQGTTTDLDGNFLLENIPVGRRNISCQYLGYSPYIGEGIVLNSAKELVLTIALIEEVMTTEEVVVQALESPTEALNQASVVSTRSFSAEETQRYAMSVNDPGRMAMGFPGVQPARDDLNSIIIRGNSAMGLLWRLEGVDILNPNHFARAGSSGGGISIFSSSVLGNSDFSTGAFPAEYGNSFSGVFDMKFRKGNREKREYSFRAGVLGLDFSAEGPIKKGRSSYLVNYRYSTLGILNDVGIHVVGERIDNNFQDLSFNLYFPSADNRTIVTLWGIGGLSKELGDVLQTVEDWEGVGDYSYYDFQTDMGATGLTYTHLIDEKSYLKSSFAVMGQRFFDQSDTLSKTKIHTLIDREDHYNSRLSFATYYSRKINPEWTIKTGFFASRLGYDLNRDTFNFEQNRTDRIIDARGHTVLIQPYAQARYKPSPKLIFNFGVHGLFFAYNEQRSIEPRASLRYQFSNQQSLSFAYGLHTRILPLGTYFMQLQNAAGQHISNNKNLELLKAHHLILSYRANLPNRLRFTAEAYYQYLFDVPVSVNPNRSYWLLNDFDGYSTEPYLVSKGTGYNIGLDLVLEKSFSKGIFFLVSASVFDSKYKALDQDHSFNTAYNTNYNFTLLGGKEWTMRNNASLEVGIKLLYNGGARTTPLRAGAAHTLRYPILDQSQAFEIQIAPYFRPDLRISYRKNKSKSAWQLALDIQNVINYTNVDAGGRFFDTESQKWINSTQSELIPVISYQIDF